MSKTYPDTTLETRLRDAGASVACLWEMRGPKDTAVAHLTCLGVNGSTVIVETFEGGGWQAFSPDGTNRVDATVEDVLRRCPAGGSPYDETVGKIAALSPLLASFVAECKAAGDTSEQLVAKFKSAIDVVETERA